MLRLQPVTPADKEALSYIEDLYVKSFPVDERRPFEKLAELLGNTPVFHLRLLCDGDKKVGFISYWQWPDLTYGEHFAVDPDERGGGYGGKALRLLCEELQTPVGLEVELPFDEMSRRRIGFYQRSGFTLSTLRYIQPPYFDGAQPLELHLMFYALPVPMESDAFSDFFCRVRDRLHRDVYGVEPGRYV